MLGDALNGVIGPIFETTWNVLKNQYDAGLQHVDDEQKRLYVQQATERAAQAYHQKYLERHCNVKVLPGLMKEAMPLDTIYTAVKFLGDSDLKYFSTLDDLEEMYRQSGKRRFRVGSDERKDGLDAANQEQYLMVLGGPGVGKSTFLRKLGLEALKGNLAHDLMPVFIELKSFKSDEQTIAQAITKELEIAGFPGPETLVESLLAEGKILVLLDGLDEVPAKQENDVIDQVRDFCDRYSQNRFVSSCRIAAYKGGFNRFIDVTMAEFDDEQIEQFIKRWFSSDLDIQAGTALRFWNLLCQPENEAAKELAQTPLLLTFLCLTYDRSQNLPTVRSTLYGDALNILLKEWAAEKRLEQDPIYQGFHADLEKELLAEIAYESFSENQLFFSKAELVERVSSFLEDTLNAPKYLDGVAVLKAIEKQQGILVERAPDAYSFSHLTLQEYLVAQYISNQWITGKLVSHHLTDRRWREVFLLVSGLLGKRSYEMWLLMQRQASHWIDSPHLQSLLNWVIKPFGKDNTFVSDAILVRARFLHSFLKLINAQLTVSLEFIDISSENAITMVSKGRMINLANTYLDYISRVSTIVNATLSASATTMDIIVATRQENTLGVGDLADFLATVVLGSSSYVPVLKTNKDFNKSEYMETLATSLAIVNAIADTIENKTLVKRFGDLSDQLPGIDSEVSKWIAFAFDCTKVYFDMFDLADKSFMLTPEDAHSLDNYLYSVKLILDCKNAAVRVSRQQWESIESRLLRVSTN
ncbi:signal transduction protein with nacht domain protein [Leptolyngbya sp. Heron Island J]|uniref:NACHT domain-containing protein n=1 Tax=Leptolyngbya sp. Heron Island J TaxID=1385935 RepID=UPI0003B961DF|nr:NACHT domain-containing protein [Leptolyngbya sp. Heron Island J]ESA36064.1 signal transduction protein with nacht domain protein [Leptolyngbya sp. Heron Island J]